MLFDREGNPLDEAKHRFAVAPVAEHLCRIMLRSALRSPDAKRYEANSGGVRYFGARTPEGFIRISMSAEGLLEKRGPGTELKRLLSHIGIHATGTCSCNAMAKQMDREGPDWCREHMEEIVDVMEKEAKHRGLPFKRLGGRALVRLAIWKAA